MPILLGDIWKSDYQNLVVVSPMWAGWYGPGRWPNAWNATWRSSTSAVRKSNVAKVMNIIGEVEGRTCVIMDDMVDTANTLCEAARALKEQGRGESAGLLYSSGIVGQGGGANREFRPGQTGGHRYHPAA